MKTTMTIFIILLSLLVIGCEQDEIQELISEPGIGKSVEWSALVGWNDDNLTEFFVALTKQCPRMSSKTDRWKSMCVKIQALNNPSATQARQFIENHFRPHEILAENGVKEGLITGYYQPILQGSRTRTDRYLYPLYSQPDDLLIVELGGMFPELEGKRVRGKLLGNKVVPYFNRTDIDYSTTPLKGNELLWVDDPYGSFFLQIQGSGRVQLEDGSLLGVNYANQNGHPYVSIGKQLVEMGEMPLQDVSLFTIRAWLQNNPDRADELLQKNPSYVFFTLREKIDENPRGSLNVPLTDMRSIAVDRKVITLGTPVWIDTTLPDGQPFQRLMIAQDTGGAISGHVRADVYFGTGNNAEQLAGTMKQSGSLYALLPMESKPVNQ